MITRKHLALLLLSVLMSVGINSEAKKTEPRIKPKLGTSFKFDGSALRGKYQSSLNTKATVENDKLLEDLLGGRKHFADKAEQDQQRN